MKSLIQKLVETTGPSGYETEVRKLVIDEIKDHVDKFEVDDLGNLITYKGEKVEGGMTIMLAAHLDEIGIIVTHVDENGFARFTTIGGVRPRNTAGGRVRFLNGAPGVIGMEGEPGILNVTKVTKMYIDLGVSTKKDCPVSIGDVAAFERTFEDYGDRIVSKALDDRVGVAVLIEVLKQLKGGPNQVVGVFTVQEEVGVRGATAAAYGVNPDLGIAIDVTLSGDTPKDDRIQVGLGKGPAIKVKDRGMISDPRLVTWMEKEAQKRKIPYQLEILLMGSTDARAIQTSRAGVPSGCVSIPCRYVHSPSEMVDINDMENAIKLLVSLLEHPVNL
ncbi:MAG: M42 family metallopeptidase [Anaerolineales bacterium]|jgi:endoglucanase